MRTTVLVSIAAIGTLAMVGTALGQSSDDAGVVFKEEGQASYYGGQFHGRATASGKPFDQNAMAPDGRGCRSQDAVRRPGRTSSRRCASPACRSTTAVPEGFAAEPIEGMWWRRCFLAMMTTMALGAGTGDGSSDPYGQSRSTIATGSTTTTRMTRPDGSRAGTLDRGSNLGARGGRSFGGGGSR